MYKVTPLLIFYLIALPLIILRLAETIWLFNYVNNSLLFCLFAPSTLKFCLGLDLAWIMTELCIQLRLNIAKTQMSLPQTP